MSLIKAQGTGDASTGFYSHTIGQSLRFEDGDNPYLSKTLSGSGGTIFTFSCWVKLGNLSINRCLLQGYADGNNYAQIVLYSGNYIGMYSATSGTARLFAYTQALQRDSNAWYNIVVKFNGTSGSEEFKIYINGENQTLTTSTSLSAHQSKIGNNNAHYVGNNFNQSLDFDGYMAEVNFIDGTALDADSFGETKAGIWIPKDTSGLTFGTNGFRLKFQDSSALGDDTSGNGNDFSSNGLAATDVVLDSPTNNFVTLNPIYAFRSGSTNYFAPTLLEGNLKADYSSSSGAVFAASTLFVDSGKWYAEVRSFAGFGWVGISHFTNSSSSSGYAILLENGSKNYNGTTVSAVDTVSDGDIIGIALDLDSGTIEFFINNSSQTQRDISSFTGSGKFFSFGVYVSGTDNLVQYNFGQDSSFSGAETAQGNTDGNGKGDFYYSPPSGFLALCSANLPDPGIDPAQDEEPADHFNTVLYTGNGTSASDTQAISGVGFSPDWTWIKGRSVASGHVLNDSVRGAGKNLFSASNTTENVGGSTGDLFTSFDSDGFTVNYTYGGGTNNSTNANGATYVSWNWLAGGSASSNSNGSITSSVSANTEAGFSIVSYTGNATAGATVGHGLSSTPEVYIVKSRSLSTSWVTYHKDMASSPEDGYLVLNGTDTFFDTVVWNDTAPTSSVFSLGGSGYSSNNSGATYIAYCFHSVDGYSKFGSYTGNGSSDGVFVYTGFRPAWVMVKKSSATQSWAIMDNKRQASFNDVDARLFADLSNSESTGQVCDFVSNGFKMRSTFSTTNGSGATYIYLAFAEQPFKFSNAR